MSEYYLCIQEGIYEVEPHKHVTLADAASCGNVWGARMALERDRYRKALEEVCDFGHAEGCKGYAPVYECCCYERSQGEIAADALNASSVHQGPRERTSTDD